MWERSGRGLASHAAWRSCSFNFSSSAKGSISTWRAQIPSTLPPISSASPRAESPVGPIQLQLALHASSGWHMCTVTPDTLRPQFSTRTLKCAHAERVRAALTRGDAVHARLCTCTFCGDILLLLCPLRKAVRPQSHSLAVSPIVMLSLMGYVGVTDGLRRAVAAPCLLATSHIGAARC